ncbi:hypothetical protein [Clostridium sp. AM58-1XD]|uniref:hypothetical protein n=1 Tax=Clostridium sp. AM58-1XD TaxID=2292307 RepID=UPI000E552E7B|nr:hypothetical protein [Clostridium sp. AM58-1XD]RGY97048.1 hypothetical protein DXA13_15770 [Clostridium sp. AM58-1XD]
MRRLITVILVTAVYLSGCKESNVKNASVAGTSTEETTIKTTEESVEETTEEVKSETEEAIEEQETEEIIKGPETEESSISSSQETIAAETVLGGKKEDKKEEQQWKQAYIKYITEEWEALELERGNTDAIYSYSLIYLNNDDIPELFVKYDSGGAFCYYNGEQLEHVVLTGWGEVPLYIERQNLFFASGGKMGVYDDVIYSIRDNHIIELYRGDFWTLMGDDFKLDEQGNPCWQYFWNGEEVASEEEYKQKISSVFDESKAISVVGNSYDKYEIIEAINSF